MLSIRLPEFAEKPVALCVGNVLLDINHRCKDDSLLLKYDLCVNDSMELDSWQLELFDDILDGDRGNLRSERTNASAFIERIQKSEIHVSPGGAAQNTARVMQWCLNEHFGKKAVAFTGCVGNDRIALLLEDQLQRDDVDLKYMYHPSARTGACAALVTKDNQRCLCANIGASKFFSSSHLSEKQMKIVIDKKSVLFYHSSIFYVVTMTKYKFLPAIWDWTFHL